MSAYYNEIDPYAAEWLRNLIAAGHIADGVVDTRSIEDVHPDDLRDFTQCHFFAGVGVWSHALRAAGWPDDRPVWTGSCPCQPFSSAGQGAGFADERHLWPAFHHLIEERRPAAVIGEQVASSHVDPWIDLVHADLEGLGYTFGAIPFPSAGVGAPHIRDRLYWLANASGAGSPEFRGGRNKPARYAADGVAHRLADADGIARGQRCADVRGRAVGGDAESRARPGGIVVPGGLAHANHDGLGAHAGAELHDAEHHAEPCGDVLGVADADDSGRQRGRPIQARDGRYQARIEPQRLCDACGLAHSNGRHARAEREQCGGQQRQQPENGSGLRVDDSLGVRFDQGGADHGSDERLVTGAADQGCGMADSELQQRQGSTPSGDVSRRRHEKSTAPAGLCSDNRPGATNGFWRDADWLGCTDGKWRPVEPGTFPLAHGTARGMGRVRADKESLAPVGPRKDHGSRVGRLRGYGNAINAEAARVWVEAVIASA